VHTSWHLHLTEPPYCLTWTQMGGHASSAPSAAVTSELHGLEAACERRRIDMGLPPEAKVGPFYYQMSHEWKGEQERHAAELRARSEDR
jgi:hypothetical protein